MPLLLQSLRQTNQQLTFRLDHMVAHADEGVVATPEQMSELLSELLRAADCLRADALPVAGIEAELDVELEKYRANVERLRELLPGIHARLLMERRRLEAQRTRVRLAADWARASRQAL